MVESLKGNVLTVLGPVKPGELGVTLTHEHLFLDAVKSRFYEPANATERNMAYEPVKMKNLWWLQKNPSCNLDNLRLRDYDEAVKEVMMFKVEGGGSIVDVTSKGLNGDPLALKKISLQTGLKVVAGTGYYVSRSHPDGMDSRSVDELAEEMERDIMYGFGETSVRAGIVGEIGVETVDPKEFSFHRNEEKVLRAAGRVQCSTGVAVSVHPPQNTDEEHTTAWWALKILDILRDEGADLSKVIICHLSRSVDDLDLQVEVARRGSYIEYDQWGGNIRVIPKYGTDRPSDLQLVKAAKELIKRGCLERMLFSHDVWLKIKRVRYGGCGYAHLLRSIVPRLLWEGVTGSQIRTILIENPARVSSFS